jgi:hypothetical protein
VALLATAFVLYRAPVAARPTFTLGSSVDEVLAAQGPPTAVIGAAWRYDFSFVVFAEGRVIGYADTSNNLSVRLDPRSRGRWSSAPAQFTRGSSADEVLAVQGTPSAVIGTTWHYDRSTVRFAGERVSGYTNTAGNLRVPPE